MNDAVDQFEDIIMFFKGVLGELNYFRTHYQLGTFETIFFIGVFLYWFLWLITVPEDYVWVEEPDSDSDE